MLTLEIFRVSSEIETVPLGGEIAYTGDTILTVVNNTVGVFVPDTLAMYVLWGPFQERQGNNLRVHPDDQGDVLFNGQLVVYGNFVEIQEECHIVVHYEDGEGGWR